MKRRLDIMVSAERYEGSITYETAKYAIANKILEEPAFAWWTKQTLKTHNCVISKIKSRYWLQTHKYGIEIPKNWQQAVALDQKNGNTLWQDAIKKEMKNVQPAFEEHDGNKKQLVGYTKITSHIIYNSNLANPFGGKLNTLPTDTRRRHHHCLPMLWLSRETQSGYSF